MLKLKRYLKPYLLFLVGGIALLFGQAMLELELPNYMSNIVNIGIQQGGITQIAPEAIDGETMQVMQLFMSDDDKAAVDAAYRQAGADDALKKFPELGEGDWILADDADTDAADAAFSRADYAFLTMMETLSSQAGSASLGDAENKTMDMSKLGDILPMLSALPQQTFDDAIATANAADESVLSQTAYVFTKGFYTQLGADTDAIQTEYLLFTGLEMLGFAVLLTVCSVSAGMSGAASARTWRPSTR